MKIGTDIDLQSGITHPHTYTKLGTSDHVEAYSSNKYLFRTGIETVTRSVAADCSATAPPVPTARYLTAISPDVK